MPISLNRYLRLENLLDELAGACDEHEARAASPRPLRHIMPLDGAALARNWEVLKRYTPLNEQDEACLADEQTRATIGAYGKNIENCVGTLKLPVGRGRAAAHRGTLCQRGVLRAAGDNRGGPGRLLPPRLPPHHGCGRLQGHAV